MNTNLSKGDLKEVLDSEPFFVRQVGPKSMGPNSKGL